MGKRKEDLGKREEDPWKEVRTVGKREEDSGKEVKTVGKGKEDSGKEGRTSLGRSDNGVGTSFEGRPILKALF